MESEEILDYLGFGKVTDLLSSEEKLMKFNIQDHYAIISVADSEDIRGSTVYEQLLKI